MAADTEMEEPKQEEPKIARRTFDLPYKADQALRAMAKKEGTSDVATLSDAIYAYATRGGLSDEERQNDIKRAVLAALQEANLYKGSLEQEIAAGAAKIAKETRAKRSSKEAA